jgi:hypothetical protein
MGRSPLAVRARGRRGVVPWPSTSARVLWPAVVPTINRVHEAGDGKTLTMSASAAASDSRLYRRKPDTLRRADIDRLWLPGQRAAAMPDGG